MKHWLVSFLAVAAGAGCALNEDLVESEASQPLKNQCDDWFCGQNSPLIKNRFYDLSLAHVVNKQGFKFVKFTKYGVSYAMHVNNATITATRPGATLSGQGLVNGQLWVERDGGATYVIKIAAVSSVPYWARNPVTPAPVVTPTYTLQWTTTDNGLLTGDFVDLCSNPPSSDGGESLGMDVHQSVVFEGDRYDDVAKRITGYDASWFNLGCAGSTLAKMHLTGHTTAAGPWFPTTNAEKQTMLNMLTANYCGDGSAFTVAGQPLLWKDDKGWMHPTSGPGASVEAFWNESGAICLNLPRVVAHPTKLAFEVFGQDIKANVEAEIADTCRRPPVCGDTSPPAHLVSVNPP